jgi:hypothetical protein
MICGTTAKRRGRYGVTEREPAPRRTDNLRRELRALYKESVWALTRHRQGPRRNICLFATRRGGSTWLMEVIGANKGVRSLDQPFSSSTGTLTAGQFRAMPKFDGGMVVALDEDQEAPFRAYVDRVMNGALPVNAPTRFWSREFDFRSERLLLKITDTNAMIDWFAQHYDVDIVYLSRHPIPQALSCIRNGWTLNVGPFLRSRRFCETHLDSDLVDYAHHVFATGNDLDRFVLNWTLENIVPMRLLDDRPDWTYLSYEHCVLEPERAVRGVAHALGLTDVAAMERALGQASRSSGLSADATVARIRTGDTGYLVGRWRQTVDAEQEKRLMAIVERFGIHRYRAGDLVADPPARYAPA